MINLFKKLIQVLNGEHAQYEQLRVSAENEYLAISCGTYNPKLLARIKNSKANQNR